MIEILDKKTGKFLRIAKPDEILKDGEVGRISLTLMDAAPPPELMLGLAALGRDPVVMTADQAKAADASHDAYERRINNAWKDAKPLANQRMSPPQAMTSDQSHERYVSRLGNAWKVSA